MQDRNPREEAIAGLFALIAIGLIYPVGKAYFYSLGVLHESLLQPAYLWLGELHLGVWLAVPVGVTMLMAWVFWPVTLILASMVMYQLFRLARWAARRCRCATLATAA